MANKKQNSVRHNQESRREEIKGKRKVVITLLIITGILFIVGFIGLNFQVEPPQVITETNDTNETIINDDKSPETSNLTDETEGETTNVTKPVRIFNLSDTNRTRERQGRQSEEREPNVYVFENPQDYFYLPSKPDKNLSLIIDYTYKKVNDERQKRQLLPLGRSSEIEGRAQTHSERMARTNIYEHDDNIKAGCGENIHHVVTGNLVNCGFDEEHDEEDVAECVVKDWMNSEGHRDNVLRVVFKSQGIGLSYDNDDDYFGNGYYFTQKLCITEPVTNVTEPEPTPRRSGGGGGGGGRGGGGSNNDGGGGTPTTPPPTTTEPPEPIINYDYTGRENLNDNEKFILYYYNKLHNLTNPFNETLTNEILNHSDGYLNPLVCKGNCQNFGDKLFYIDRYSYSQVRDVFNLMKNNLLDKGLKTYCPDVPNNNKTEFNNFDWSSYVTRENNFACSDMGRIKADWFNASTLNSTPRATYHNGNRHPEDVLGEAYSKYVNPDYNLSGVEFTGVRNSTDCGDLRNSINRVSSSFYDLRNDFRGLYSKLRLDVIPFACGNGNFTIPDVYSFFNRSEFNEFYLSKYIRPAWNEEALIKNYNFIGSNKNACKQSRNKVNVEINGTKNKMDVLTTSIRNNKGYCTGYFYPNGTDRCFNEYLHNNVINEFNELKSSYEKFLNLERANEENKTFPFYRVQDGVITKDDDLTCSYGSSFKDWKGLDEWGGEYVRNSGSYVRNYHYDDANHDLYYDENITGEIINEISGKNYVTFNVKDVHVNRCRIRNNVTNVTKNYTGSSCPPVFKCQETNRNENWIYPRKTCNDYEKDVITQIINGTIAGYHPPTNLYVLSKYTYSQRGNTSISRVSVLGQEFRNVCPIGSLNVTCFIEGI